jgi:dTDP-4-amino-4,6-dideoxygalactose transaminase
MTKTAIALKPISASRVQTRLTAEEEQVLLRVLREADTLALGVGAPENDAFERDFRAFVGCADAVAVNSCSSALELAAILSGLGPSDEVILPAHTFVATAVPFGRTGATVRWADIDPDTRVISAASVARLITSRTKAVVAVHLYGLPADMDALLALAAKHQLTVVEDCAQAPGALYRARQVGSLGHFGCFSFHTSKNMQTLGEGGMLTVRDPRHAVQARRLRWMGIWSWEGGPRAKDWVPAGNNLVEPIPGRWPGNYCMGEANAAVGRQMLKRLDRINRQRRHQAAHFHIALEDYPELVFQRVPEGCEHAYHLMAARYDGALYGKHRDDLMLLLRDKYQLRCIAQYWPLNRSELFRKFGFGEADVPESDRFYDNMISFPWWSDMSDELLDDMAERTRNALDELRGT